MYVLVQPTAAQVDMPLLRLLPTRALLTVGATCLVVLLDLLLAAANLQPSLEEVGNLNLGVVAASSRPEVGYLAVLLLAITLLANLHATVLAARLLRPTRLAMSSLRTANRRDLIEYLTYSAGDPEPTDPDQRVVELAGNPAQHGIVIRGATMEERTEREAALRRWEERRLRREERALRGELVNPLQPPVIALYMLVRERHTVDLIQVWRTVCKTLTDWIEVDEGNAAKLSEWLWETTEELVRECLTRNYESGALALVRETLAAQESTVGRFGGWEGRPEQHLSRVAQVSLNSDHVGLVSEVVKVYANAAARAIERQDQRLFDFGVLGLGWIIETTAHFPRPVPSMIASNRNEIFARSPDPAHEAAGELLNLTTPFRWDEPGPELSLLMFFDACSLAVRCSLDGEPERHETALHGIDAITEMMERRVGPSNPESFDRACMELAHVARRLNDVVPTPVTERAWERLAVAVLKGALDPPNGTGFPPLPPGKVVLMREVAPLLPADVQNSLGELAHSLFLGHGIQKFKVLRAELEEHIGELDNWPFKRLDEDV